MEENIQNIQTPPPVVVEKKNNKGLKIALIIVSVLLFFAVAFITLIVIYNINLEEESIDNESIEEVILEQEEEEESVSDHIDAANLEISEHTDIRLKKYEGLYGRIFLGFDDVDDELAEWVYPVIISYYPKDHADYMGNDSELAYSLYGPYMEMGIVNRNSAKTEEHRITFQRSLDTILERDTNIDSGHLPAFRQYLWGGSAHRFIKEIKDLEYTGIDNVFSVFLIGGYQDGPWERSENIEDFWGLRFIILVFGVKGDNLITLTLSDRIDRVLDLSIERHYSCIDFTKDADDGLYDYDLACIKEILQGEEFNQPIKDLANQLISRFEIL